MMPQERAAFWIALILIIVASSLQSQGLVRIGGVVPNLTLVALVVSMFFVHDIVPYLLLLLTGSIFLRFTPGFGKEVFLFTVVLLIMYWLRSRIVWPGSIANLFLIAIATGAFILLIAPSFLYDATGIVLKELFYNLILGLILYGVSHFFYEKRARSRIR